MQPIIDEEIIIPLNNVACSHHHSIIEPRHGSSSGTSQTLDAVLQSPEAPSPSDDRTAPSSPLHVFVSDDSNSPKFTAQRHFVTSPTVYTRQHHHSMPGYRSDSTESTEKLGSGEISRSTRDMTLVAESSHSSFYSSRRLSREDTIISSPTCVEDKETPALTQYDISPVAPEHFSRYKKRRKM